MKQLKLILAIVFFVGCVPLKQYQETNDQNAQLEEENEYLKKDNEEARVKNNELAADAKRLSQAVDQLKEDTTRQGQQLQKLRFRYSDLEDSYHNALVKWNQRSGGDSESKQLLAYLQQLQEELQKREDQLLLSEKELVNKKRSLEEAIAELEQTHDRLNSQNERLLQLESALHRKDSIMVSLKKAVADALTGFTSDELEVHSKNGKIYVSMEEKLLFRSGSYEVNEMGKGALKRLGAVLVNQPDIEILVEGHTDNVPYKGTLLLDNWDLSVKRATSVVRILIANSGIEPVRIAAAGRSEYLPVADPNTSEGRKRNRRTEIILEPSISHVLDVLEIN
ncbi:flagellar motor protein MotB [Marinilabiliaceae bacterium JC017]|nr:flagellar motor protein MotB [Marinilabiliaceae bacterium JC017]